MRNQAESLANPNPEENPDLYIGLETDPADVAFGAIQKLRDVSSPESSAEEAGEHSDAAVVQLDDYRASADALREASGPEQQTDARETAGSAHSQRAFAHRTRPTGRSGRASRRHSMALPEENEDELFKRWEKGDQAAREELIHNFLPMVRHIAIQYAERGSQPIEDIVQVGCIGLLKAMNRYDRSKGFAFTSFAYPTITGEIKRHFRDYTWDVQVPRDLQELSRAALKVKNRLEQNRQVCTPRQVAEEMGLPEQEVSEALQVFSAGAYNVKSLDAPAGKDGDAETTYVDLVVDPHSTAEYDMVLQSADLQRAISLLPTDRARTVISLLLEGLSQQEVGERIGVSQMQVSRDYRNAIKALASLMKHDRT
jgi:RNA polymerase sigma-B factor